MKTISKVLILCGVILIGFFIFIRAKQTNSTSGWVEEDGIMTYKSDGIKIADGNFGGLWVEDDCIHALNATTTTGESQWFNISDANRVSLYLQRSNDDAGSTLFTINASPNASDYDVYERLILNDDNTDSNNQDRVSSTTIAGDDTIMLSFSPEDVPNYIKIVETETTDGTHDAWICAQKNN